MRTLSIVATCLLVAALSACSIITPEPPEVDLQVVLNRGFQGDFVRVSIDDDVIVSDTLTDSWSAIGLPALARTVTLPTGTYEITVSLNETFSRSVPFRTRDVRSIWIVFDRETRAIEITMHPDVVIIEG